MAMVNRVEIFLDINIDTPSYSLTHEGCSESIQRLMGRAAWSEAIRAGEEILLVYCLQYHGTLCHFVFECRDACCIKHLIQQGLGILQGDGTMWQSRCGVSYRSRR